MTSKGQVTIPTELRKHFGFHEGQKFDVKMSNDGVLFVPRGGWDEVFEAAAKINEQVRKRNGGKKIRWSTLKAEVDNIKTEELRNKYFGDK